MNCCEVDTIGSKPWVDRRSRASGPCMIFDSAPVSVPTTSFGRLAGPYTPCQEYISNAGKPCSIIVGTSGSAADRFAAVTPSARTLPARICGRVAIIVPNMPAMWPP